jgi:hypothetical protein
MRNLTLLRWSASLRSLPLLFFLSSRSLFDLFSLSLSLSLLFLFLFLFLSLSFFLFLFFSFSLSFSFFLFLSLSFSPLFLPLLSRRIETCERARRSIRYVWLTIGDDGCLFSFSFLLTHNTIYFMYHKGEQPLLVPTRVLNNSFWPKLSLNHEPEPDPSKPSETSPHLLPPLLLLGLRS